MRDLLDAPEAEWRRSGRRWRRKDGARGSSLPEDPDGQWAGGAFWPPDVDWRRREQEGQPWTATCWALTDFASSGSIPRRRAPRRTVELVGENSRWEEGGQPFWEGEVEECINGRTAAAGAYFGVDVGEDRDAAGGRAAARRRLELRAG